MAYVSGNSPDQGANTDQDPNKNPLADQAPITSAPAGGGGSGKPSGQASSSGPSQPFTNLSAYLSANGPQVQQMGSDIAGQLGTDYTNTNNAIAGAKDSYNAGVKGGYTPYDQSLIDSFNTNPAAVAGDPTKAASFKGMYNDRYTGPGNFQDAPEYADLSGKVQKSAAFADQVSTLPGLQSYLSSKSPTYTQGQATLDSALLQTNPDAVKTIADATQPFKNLPGYLDEAVTSGNAASKDASQQAQQAKVAAQAAAGTFSDNFAKTQNDQMTAYAKQAQDYNNLMNSANEKINSGNYAGLTPEEAKLIGYNPVATKYISDYTSGGPLPSQAAKYPIDFRSFWSQGDSARMPTSADVFSPAELANYQALQQLTGNGPMLNFDAPTEGKETANGAFAMPGKLPQYNNNQALSSIYQNYDRMVSQAPDQMPQNVTDYMSGLKSTIMGGQPSPTPTSPMPTDGGLGAGYHWNTDTGTWQVTIPLQPTNPPPTGGGGHATF